MITFSKTSLFILLQDGLSCLHLKETLESPDIVQLLIDKGADFDNLTDVCVTVLS